MLGLFRCVFAGSLLTRWSGPLPTRKAMPRTAAARTGPSPMPPTPGPTRTVELDRARATVGPYEQAGRPVSSGCGA